MSDSVTAWTVTPPGCSVHGTSRARILQWVVISSSRGLSTYPVPNSIFYKGLFTITATLGDKCFCVCVSPSVVSDSLPPHGLGPTRLLCPWDSPGKNPGVGCHLLLQGIFPTQASLFPLCIEIILDSLSCPLRTVPRACKEITTSFRLSTMESTICSFTQHDILDLLPY